MSSSNSAIISEAPLRPSSVNSLQPGATARIENNTFCRFARRIYQRLRVIASYEPGAGFSGPMASVFGGLCNQIYTHVGMLAVALHCGCEVVRALLNYGFGYGLILGFV